MAISAASSGGPAPPRPWLLYSGLLLIQLTNVTYNVLTKTVTDGKGGANPLIFSLYRDTLAFPLLLFAALAIEGRVRVHARDLPRLALLGLTGMFGNQFLFLEGMHLTNDATFAGVTTRFQPVFGALVAMAIGLERFLWLKMLAVALSVGGALMMGWSDLTGGGGSGAAGGEQRSLGVALLLGGALSMSMYYILQKPLLRAYPPVTVTAYSYAFASLLMGAASLYYVPWTPEWAAENHVDWVLTRNGWLAVGFAAVFNSCLKYALASYCNRHVSVTQLTLWGTLVPILTAVADPIFLHHHLSPYWQYAGIAPIVAGLFLIVWCNARYSDACVRPSRAQRYFLRILCRDDGLGAAAAIPGSDLAWQPLINEEEHDGKHA